MVVGKFGGTNLPPGFRFHPTDEELIMYYLKNQATSSPCPAPIIPEVDIYKFDPWELPDKAVLGENEWYFFSPRDRKYPNGVRPNRAAVSGYWKATGTDKSIYSGRKYVGIKKALVFYKGKPPKGIKTDWIMHEYRLSASRPQPLKQNGSMRLDDWVLCRIYKKKNVGRTLDQRIEDSNTQIFTPNEASDNAPKLEFPRTNSISHLWELDCLGSLSQLLNENSQHSSFGNYTNTMGNSDNAPREINKITLGELPKQYMDSLKLQANHSSLANQHGFVDQLFQFQK